MLPPMWPRPTKPMLVISAISGTPFERRDILVAQLEIRRADDRVDLVGAPEADDRAVDGRVSQRPGDRDGARSRVEPAPDRLEPLHEREIPRESWLPELLVVPAPVVLRQALDALAGHGTG